jgi:phosphoenolpyruvate carboxylase
MNRGFDKIEADITNLLNEFVKVMQTSGDGEITHCLPWVGSREASHSECTSRMIQAYSIAFQLLNMVEENTANQLRRKSEQSGGFANWHGLWGSHLKAMKDAGLNEQEIASAISKVSIEPVLTAHPTESKRISVLELHRELYLRLVQKENTMWTDTELEDISIQIRSILERLWRTGEIYLTKPSVSMERQGMEYYLTQVFPTAISKVIRRLKHAWVGLGFDLDTLNGNLPHIKLGTWVGGDRDGHPLVTAKVTEETLVSFRINALRMQKRTLEKLRARLSLAAALQTVPDCLLEGIAEQWEVLGGMAATICERNQGEPWRQFVSLMIARIPIKENEVPENAELSTNYFTSYRFSSALIKDLELLKKSLLEINATHIVEEEVDPAIHQCEVFGFHLATLDIRQNSTFHDRAIRQILDSIGFKDCDYENWSDEKRIVFLNSEINCSREAGLLIDNENGEAVCPIPIVPLLETVGDLYKGAAIVEAFITHPMTRRSQAWMNKQHKRAESVQQVMIGYSDSNKDKGIFASQWTLHLAQSEITAIAKRHGVRIRYFHGRGGTISRGAGPTDRFLEALPAGTLGFDLRTTEQGETIAQKFTNLITATYNIELFASGVSRYSAINRSVNINPELRPILQKISDLSAKTYEELLNHENFIDFYRQATPIDVLEKSRIGSRPSRRTGARSLDDLRAIPWVFSWSQSRFFLPGWYGVGSALSQIAKQSPKDYELLKTESRKHPFLVYVLTNVEASMLSVDTTIMQGYASLVSDESVRSFFMNRILQEYNWVREILADLMGNDIEARRPNLLNTLQRRSSALTMLNYYQIQLLREWRAQTEPAKEANPLLDKLLLTVNAIAGGLKTTG